MTNPLVFSATAWPWIAAGSIMAAVLLGALEWRRASARRGMRAALVALAVLSLGAIGLQPARERPIRTAGSLVLATPGGDLHAGRVPARAVALAESLHAPLVVRDTIPDLAWLRRRHPALDTLHVVGGGLNAADRRAAEGLVLRVHVTELPGAGLVRLSWTRAPAVGEPIVVGGRLAGAAPGTWVRLVAPGGVADSVRSDSSGGFVLAARPRAAARQLYVVETVAGGAAIAETLGVAVEPVRPPSVLVLEAAPSFETRHLKTWIGERGGELAVRSLVGRGVHRYEYLNRAEIPLARIAAGTLAGFDVVVTDGRSIASLSPGERAALRSAVADSGRGLLLLADDVVLGRAGTLPDRDFFLAAQPARLAGPDRREVRLAWASRAVPASAWSLPERFGTYAPAADAAGRALIRIAPRGAGRVGVTVITEPGRWLLGGDRAAFAEYWTRLLTPLAAGVRRPRWEVATGAALEVDAGIDLALSGSDTATEAVVTGPGGEPERLVLVGDPVEPTRRRAVWWPREAGWHRIEGGGAALDFRVRPRGPGSTLQASAQVASTRRTAVRGRPGARTADDAAALSAVRRPISPLPFFLSFVVATGLLWVVSGPRAPAGLSEAPRAAAPARPPDR